MNTLEAYEALDAAGFSKKQAKAVVQVISDVDDRSSTKSDINNAVKLLLSQITNRILAATITIIGVMIALKFWVT